MKKLFLNFFVFLIAPCFLVASKRSMQGEGETDYSIVLTIPKSGTHLIKKYLYLVKYIYPRFKTPIIDHIASPVVKDDPDNPYRWNPDLYAWMKAEKPVKYVLLIRDLRDIAVSVKFHFLNGLSLPRESPRDLPPLYEPPFLDEVLENLHFILDSNFPKLIVKFEDLVGPKGGGSAQKQKVVIKEIAQFLGIKLLPKEVNWIAARLFGAGRYPEEITLTFRSGQIGEWKAHFSQEDKEKLKEKYGQFLIDFGYEKNDDW